MPAIAPILSSLSELIFPAVCLHCQVPGADYPLCAACLGSLRRLAAEPACPLCGSLIVLDDAGCQRCENKGLPHIDTTLRLTVYAGPARTLLLRAKFSRDWPLLEYLAKLAREDAVFQELASNTDALLPVPLHPRRLWSRGFNQSALIARTLQTGKPILHTLKRVRHTDRQSKQSSATARKRNVKDAFTVTRPAVIEGRRILLIDDILTTGSTVTEAARTLKKAGAKSIATFTLATADPRAHFDE